MNNENIKKYEFKKGQCGNPNGRPRKLSKMIGSIPVESQIQIYSVLHTALTFSNVKDAAEYIKEQDSTDFKYGFILQLAVRELTGKRGWAALNDILDRLYGKPKQTTEVEGQINIVKPTVVFVDEPAE